PCNCTPRRATTLHAVPLHHTPCHCTHAVPLHPTLYHCTPRRATTLHVVPLHPTPCHYAPRRATASHAVPLYHKPSITHNVQLHLRPVCLCIYFVFNAPSASATNHEHSPFIQTSKVSKD
ncbi:hypothetical protein LSAT2_023332, partial [Lamellibrachia satsuma]